MNGHKRYRPKKSVGNKTGVTKGRYILEIVSVLDQIEQFGGNCVSRSVILQKFYILFYNSLG